MKVAINESTLTAIGDAIREKTETTDLIAPGSMPAAIRSITTGGGETPSVGKIDLQYTNCDRMFQNDCWDSFLEIYGERVFDKYNFVRSASYMFAGVGVERIPFSVSVKGEYYTSYNYYDYGSMYMSYMFSGCKNLIEQPNAKPLPSPVYDPWGKTETPYPISKRLSVGSMFSGCEKLKQIDLSGWDWDSINEYGVSCGSMFGNCYSLRTLNLGKLHRAKGNTKDYENSLGSNQYEYFLCNCYVLNTISFGCLDIQTDLNLFNKTFEHCHRLKDIYLGGSSATRKWCNQVIDLSNGVGYDNTGNCAKYLEDTTKEIKGDGSYQDYKDDVDSFTKLAAYSRYNRKSAENTLGSLPDTSAYVASTKKSNTIKFRGDAGSATSDGAIDSMTDSKIAAAAAKGWTVSFVY